MFTAEDSKINANKYRQLLQSKGHSVRSAARALGIDRTIFNYLLAAHDEPEQFARKLHELPPRTPAKLRPAKSRPARRGASTKKATAQ
ncbi:MAG: hypothetical protein EA353_03740 [Puniceicoccaceae bacterium]|nr:MAG: hypothetical protein EA353_03740 [Puniceicoccaceae bacterium]